MTKNEMIEKVAEKTGLTKKDAGTAIDAYNEVLMEALMKEGKATVKGFGAFEVKTRAERMGRNPKTKEAIVIPASKALTFKPAKSFKDALNGN